MKINAPIFVVGPPRSGTSLVAKILGRHSSIFMPGETDFFDDIYSRRQDLGDLEYPEARQKVLERLRTLYDRYNHTADQQRVDKLFSIPSVLDELQTSCRNYRDILTTFMNIQMRYHGKSRWGNNVPKDIFNIDKILSFYPDAKILVCIRDPRDFLVSYKQFWRGGSSKEHRDRRKMLYHPVVTSLLWKASLKQIEAARALIPKHNLLIVRYESLVENPPEVTQEICKTIEVNFESQMLELEWHNSSSQIKGRGIFSSSVGRWRNELENEEIHLAQTITAQELGKFGYAPEKVTIARHKLAYVVATLPYALYKALYFNRAHRGPLFPYVTKRISSLFS